MKRFRGRGGGWGKVDESDAASVMHKNSPGLCLWTPLKAPDLDSNASMRT